MHWRVRSWTWNHARIQRVSLIISDCIAPLSETCPVSDCDLISTSLSPPVLSYKWSPRHPPVISCHVMPCNRFSHYSPLVSYLVTASQRCHDQATGCMGHPRRFFRPDMRILWRDIRWVNMHTCIASTDCIQIHQDSTSDQCMMSEWCYMPWYYVVRGRST